MAQLDIWGNETSPRRGRSRPVAAAEPSERAVAAGRRLPEKAHFGTSSWSFPGWEKLVYGELASVRRLARDGLAAYAAHPVFRSVAIDRTHYGPIGAADFARYADAVPAGFRFLVKGHEVCTLTRYPEHARYGSRRGQDNELFLDPAYATDAVVGPTVEGLGPKLGILLFQLAPQPLGLLGGPDRFADRLHEFLDRLPRGPQYAVEVRNAPLLTRRYADALADVGAVHCINLIPKMPDPIEQARILGAGAFGPALVVRWLLARHHDYESARRAYQPFGALVDPDPDSRRAVARLVARATAAGKLSYVIANNKAEGSSPLTLVELAHAVADELDAPAS